MQFLIITSSWGVTKEVIGKIIEEKRREFIGEENPTLCIFNTSGCGKYILEIARNREYRLIIENINNESIQNTTFITEKIDSIVAREDTRIIYIIHERDRNDDMKILKKVIDNIINKYTKIRIVDKKNDDMEEYIQ